MGYLPGTPGERIGDLRTKKGMSKGQLAKLIGVSDSTLSRIESGQIEKLNDDIVIKVARVFNVSTDFLLCETDIPDRLSFDIGELGLSAQSARNLYTRRVNPEVVNRLLENPRFALLTTEIFQYFTDENAVAYAAHNQLLRSMSDLVAGIAKADPSVKGAARQAKVDIELRKAPVHQFEIDIPLRRRRQYAIPSPPFGRSSTSIASSAGQPAAGEQPPFPPTRCKRYNTLDFARQSRVPTGASRPYWKPRAEGLDHPSGHPAIFSDTARHLHNANDVPALENAKQTRHPSYLPDGCRVCFGALRRGSR